MRRGALLLVLFTAFSAAPAAASRTQMSIFQDDHLLLYSGPQVRDHTLDEISGLGARTVRVVVKWSLLAPAPKSKARPVVSLDDPANYGSWVPLDGLAFAAQARGLRLLFTVSGPGPRWATQCAHVAPSKAGICMPRVAYFAAFVRAVGKRYSGAYAVEGQALPRVDAWSIWNEPNHKGWLIPQTSGHGRQLTYVGAIRYRKLAQAGLSALRATGHAGDLRLIGETSPVGGSMATPPLAFYRALFCLIPRQRCSSRPHFDADGVAHHPYTSGGIAVPAYRGARDDIPIGALSRLVSVLPRRMQIYLTEFGYQTHPPDPFGVSLARQAEYLNYADYVAFRNPRVASVAQYALRDDPTTRGFNTGLRFANGRAKPALAAYALPIYVSRSGRTHVTVFGLARAARTLPASVAIQGRRSGGFKTIRVVRTNQSGYLLTRLPARAAQWRLALTEDGKTRYSRVTTTR